MNAVRCPCGVKDCVNGSAKTHDGRLRRKLASQQAKLAKQQAEINRLKTLKAPILARCDEVEEKLKQFREALELHVRKARLIDVDLTQRYLLIQALGLKLSELTSPAESEAFIRNEVRAPIERTLGPLENIFRAMHENERIGQAAALEPDRALPSLDALPKVLPAKR